VLVTTDRALIDEVAAVAATVSVAPDVLGDPASLVTEWPRARMVLIGQDAAAQVAGLGLPPGPTVHLVGRDAARLAEWSMPLRATVVELPGGAAWLAGSLAGVAQADEAPVVVVAGSSGGVGASTLAAGLAYRAAQRGMAAVLVDADPAGGGLDLLVGAERREGWRWDRFARVEGHLGDLRPVLPRVEGLDLLSMGRPAGVSLAREPVAAVVGSLRRTHDLVVIDPGRTHLPGPLECRRLATRALVVVGCQVRSIAAAAHSLADWPGEPPALVARAFRNSGISPHQVGEHLGLPLAGSLPDDPDLPVAAERGEPPGRSARRRNGWGRACEGVLNGLL
jgi:secretion/DNA translocation related CpaE-like protein